MHSGKLRSILIFLAASAIAGGVARGQVLTQAQGREFARLLACDSDSLKYFVDSTDLETSSRLGIRYSGVANKFLISYGLPHQLSGYIASGSYDLRIDSLPGRVTRLVLSVPQENFEQSYFFLNGKLISPMSFYSRKWTRIRSKYFIFIVSDTNDCNVYSRSALDKFVDTAVSILDIDAGSVDLLKREKIYYYLCHDQGEIKALTGFNTRGICNLAYDCVVSTYPCHYHELLHLLMNFRLRRLHLYTLPLLQEGFAVALGGRGGLDPGAVLNAGAFLVKSGAVDIHDLLSRKSFDQIDPSLSYPVAGLFSRFLLKEIGLVKYLELYVKYSGTDSGVERMMIDTTDLPPETKWTEFVDRELRDNPVQVGPVRNLSVSSDSIRGSYFTSDANRFYFWIRDTLLLSIRKSTGVTHSNKFSELFPSRKYSGERYAIIADSSDISIYDLYTCNLIGSYVQSFSMPSRGVKKERSFYYFSVSKTIFGASSDEPMLK